jgi:hypothetical protein
LSAGVLVFEDFELRPWRINCWIVGTYLPSSFVSFLAFGHSRTLQG